MKLFRYLPLLAFLCFSAISCKKQAGPHLPPKKMQAVLYDVGIAESFSAMSQNNAHAGGAKNTDSLALYYRRIFASHHITEQQFKESMLWYKNHQDDLDSIYTNLSARADKVLNEANKKLNKN